MEEMDGIKELQHKEVIKRIKELLRNRQEIQQMGGQIGVDIQMIKF